MSIIVRGLRKTFRSGDRRQVVNAVDDLSLDVEAGELVVILGPSGSGKTTLLRCIAGLERADSGEIIVEGNVVFSSERGVWIPPERRGISMVFQSYALWPHMTVFDNVAYPLRLRRVPAASVRERVASALQMVGCGTLGARHPNEISGGQQQRVAVARAIIGGSRVVLFDEPLSSIDARVREELRHELVALQRELGFASVYITHDQTEAMAIGHRVAVLAEGKIVQIAAPRELFGRPASSYVAEFMGASNQFAGTLESSDDDYWRVLTDLGPIVARRTGSDFEAAQAVKLIVRPEDCRIAMSRPTDGHNLWECTVQSSLFLGYCTEYRLRVGDHHFLARSTEKTIARDASRIWLDVAPSDVRLVAAQ